MNICAIDPGGTCGMALLLGGDDNVSTLHLMQQRNASEFALAEWCLVTCMANECDVLVVEKFIPQPGKNYTWQSLSAMRIASMIETLLIERGMAMNVDWVWQTPSDKSIVTDDRLKQWGAWRKGRPHAMDALRHLIVYLRRHELPWRPADWFIVA
jgi:hypothetical protein